MRNSTPSLRLFVVLWAFQTVLCGTIYPYTAEIYSDSGCTNKIAQFRTSDIGRSCSEATCQQVGAQYITVSCPSINTIDFSVDVSKHYVATSFYSNCALPASLFAVKASGTTVCVNYDSSASKSAALTESCDSEGSITLTFFNTVDCNPNSLSTNLVATPTCTNSASTDAQCLGPPVAPIGVAPVAPPTVAGPVSAPTTEPVSTPTTAPIDTPVDANATSPIASPVSQPSTTMPMLSPRSSRPVSEARRIGACAAVFFVTLSVLL